MSVLTKNGLCVDAIEIGCEGSASFGCLKKQKIFPPKYIKHIAEKTHWNDHNGSVLFLAKCMGNEPAIKVMEHVFQIQMTLGHMPPGLMDLRREILETLLKLCRWANIKNYDALAGAF